MHDMTSDKHEEAVDLRENRFTEKYANDSKLGMNAVLFQWDSLGCSSSGMSIADGLDDDSELRLKRSTTDEEAIDIGLSDQLSAVASVS